MIDERRDDLNYHPCSLLRPSAEFVHADGCLSDVSAPLCDCRRKRSLVAAVRDISAVRDMPVWTFDLLRPKAEVVSLADVRLRRAAR